MKRRAAAKSAGITTGRASRWTRLRRRVDLFRPGWRGALGAGLVSGLGWALAFPPVSLWPAVLLIVWPTLWTSDKAAVRSPWRAGMWFAVGTAPAWAWLTRWAAEGAAAGFPLLVGYLMLYAGLAVWAMARIHRAWPRFPMPLVAPVVWVGVEFLRGRIAFDGFPWFLLAHPLIDAPAAGGNAGLAWPAMFLGTYAVGGLVVLATALIDRFIQTRRPRWALLALGLGVVWPLGSFAPWVVDESDSPRPVVGVVQTSIPQSLKSGWPPSQRWADWQWMHRAILDLAARDDNKPDVVVLPETMFPGFVLQNDAAEIECETGVAWRVMLGDGREQAIRAETVRDDLLRLSTTLGRPMLIGAMRYADFAIRQEGDMLVYDHRASYNSVFRVEDGKVDDETYDKQHLTPFGEVMPYISAWPWLEHALLGLAARGMSFDLDTGTRRTVFEIQTPGGPLRCVTPICFEATLSDLCRGLVYEKGKRRADLIVNVTNDGWFYTAAGGRSLHEMAARWRCVELATPMVRAANTGISGSIDRRGVVESSLGPGRAGVLVAPVRSCRDTTVYGRIGDAAAWFSLAVAIFGVGLTYTGLGRRNRTDPGPDDDNGAGADAPRSGGPEPVVRARGDRP